MADFTGIVLCATFAAVGEKPLVICLRLGDVPAVFAAVFVYAWLTGEGCPHKIVSVFLGFNMPTPLTLLNPQTFWLRKLCLQPGKLMLNCHRLFVQLVADRAFPDEMAGVVFCVIPVTPRVLIALVRVFELSRLLFALAFASIGFRRVNF
jgi:hypothetical protein